MRDITMGALALVVLCTVGCSEQATGPTTTTTSEGQKSQAPSGTTAAQKNTALVRFINANPTAKGLDIWSGDARAFSNVAYKMTTPYREMPAHAGRFQLRDFGATQDLAVGRREIFPGRHYTLVALSAAKHASTLVALSDNLAELEPGKARVRLINATVGVDDLDLFVSGTKTRIQHGVDASSASSFTDVDPGTLEIRLPGKAAPPELANLKVEADRLYTFIVTGTAGTLDVIRVEDKIDR